MALAITSGTQKYLGDGVVTIAPGLKLCLLAASCNASAASFTVVVPSMGTLYRATAVAFGSADTTNNAATCTSTMGSSGNLSMASGNVVTFTKVSTASQDFVVELLGA